MFDFETQLNELLRELLSHETVGDPQLARYLSELCDHGFVKKEEDHYLIADPVIKHTL